MRVQFIKTKEQSWWFILYVGNIPRFCVAWHKDHVRPFIGFPKITKDPQL